MYNTSLYNITMEKSSGVQVNLGELKGFAVHPKTDCPHVRIEDINYIYKLFDTKKGDLLPGTCKVCGSEEENWICICCSSVYCSRYVKGHMAQHFASSKDEIALSFTDGSVWCYECDSYITSAQLNNLAIKFSSIKFPTGSEEKEKDEMDKLVQKLLNSLQINEKNKQEPLLKETKEQQKYTKEKLIEDIKNKRVKKIVFLTGTGISVSAGIPDFRSPGSGLYSRLEKYNLPQPEAVFDIKFFKSNPEPFYKLSKQLFSAKVTPTIAHKFIKKTHDEEQLLKSITQNIDSLEINAGLPESKLIQAHGHSRSVHCIGCSKSCDVEEFLKAIQNDVIMKCSYGGLAKPDITFFGEALPVSFHEAPEIMADADLVIVMGTPWQFDLVKDDTPIVLINNNNSLGQRFPNALWLDGHLDTRIEELCDALGWKL